MNANVHSYQTLSLELSPKLLATQAKSSAESAPARRRAQHRKPRPAPEIEIQRRKWISNAGFPLVALGAKIQRRIPC